jgi:high affinity Mn2+ porin
MVRADTERALASKTTMKSLATTRERVTAVLCGVAFSLVLTATPAALRAQDGDSSASADQSSSAPETLFPHPESTRWWVSGQINTILQGHPAFSAAYTGTNSLKPEGEIHGSRVLTLYTGLELTRTTEVFVDVESAGGRGISDAFGLAGFTDLDVVRNPSLGQTPYLARAMIRQIIALGSEATAEDRGPFALAKQVPRRRFELRAGKFGMVDFFDVNELTSDSHLHFLNWTIDNNGGYDYAADTRGYTYGVMLEYDDRGWAVRFAEALMPKVANGINLDGDLRRARAENLELELHPTVFGDRASAVRLLSYVNHANMGDYREAVALFLTGRTPRPLIEETRQQGRVKYGFGVNLEQEITRRWRAFGRFGWNEGAHESFAYTEVNQTFSFGTDYSGDRWRRKQDRAGLSYVTNAISGDHQEYLKLGGLGFLLGDSNLDYGREEIFEGYYNAHFWRGIYGAFDLQHIENPGYNRARGPVWVPGLRLHLEL